MQELKEWAKTVDLRKDVVLSSDKSTIVSIKGKPVFGTGAIQLCEIQQICSDHSIILSRQNSSIPKALLLILQFVKGEPMRDLMTKTARKPKSSASAHPTCVTKDGTIYRVILSLTCEAGKSSYLATGSRLTRQEIDNKLGHGFSLATNLSIYLDKEHAELKSLGFDCDIFHQYRISQDISNSYDALNIQEFKTVVNHIQTIYRETVNNNRKSGNHQNFSNYVGHYYWLMLYRHRVCTTGSPEMQQLAYAELPQPMTSLSPSTESSPSFEGDQSSQEGQDCAKGSPKSDTESSPKKRITEHIECSHASRKRIMVTLEKQKILQLKATMVDRREVLLNKILDTKQKIKNLSFDTEIVSDLNKMLDIYKDEMKAIDAELKSNTRK